MKKGFFRILIVDDSKGMRSLLRQIIDRNNITPYIEEAEDGKTALIKFAKFKPDLVILDLRMPAMDGLDVLQKMKRLDPSSYVLITTASTAKNDTQDAIKYGAYDYIVKPFDKNEIFIKIMKSLREKASRDKMVDYVESLNKAIKF